jgi:hypothetical protein
MSRPPRVALAVLGVALSPAEALAHASERGHVLLLPTGHYLVGGAVAVAVSFVVLALLPPGLTERVAKGRIDLLVWSDARRAAVSLASFVFLALLVAAGFIGSRDPLANPLPLFVWTGLWVGFTLVQGVVGNVWHWLNPWYGPYRLVRLFAPAAPVSMPASWGTWPAFFLFAAFAWFELVYPAPDDPTRLAFVVAVYFAATFVAMLIFGFDEWSSRGEFLTVFFMLISRLGLFGCERDGSRRTWITMRWPGARLARQEPLTLSGAAFLLLSLGSVSFDGFSKTFTWLGLNGVNPLEYPGRTAMIGTNTLGLAFAFAVLGAFFLAAVVLGERLAANRAAFRDAAGLLVWSIVPIALAYHFSHYLTALLVNGQYAMIALSDPFSRGWNLLGLTGHHVHAGIVAGSSAAWMIWNLQAGSIIAGHVLAVLIAHALSFRLHPDARSATVAQIPLTLLMIAYTVFGLWLLSTPTAG